MMLSFPIFHLVKNKKQNSAVHFKQEQRCILLKKHLGLGIL